MCNRLSSILCFAVVFVGLTLRVSGFDVEKAGRRLHSEEMAELVEHLSQFPPDTSRVHVLDEFEIKAESEGDLRNSVDGMYRKLDRIEENDPVTDGFKKEVDKEVARLLKEQQSRRRIMAREQIESGNALKYRYDKRIIPPDMELPTDAGFEDTVVVIRQRGSEFSDAFRLDWKRKIAERLGPSGGKVAHQKYWELGSIGRVSVSLLRQYLEMGGKTRLQVPNPDKIQNLMEGIRTNDGLPVEITVREFEHDDYGDVRELVICIGDLVVACVVLPATEFYPILEHRAYADGKLVIHSRAFGILKGERVPEGYTIEKPFADKLNDRWHRTTILDYTINTPLEVGVFDFAIPDDGSWSTVDFVTRKITEAGGQTHGFPSDIRLDRQVPTKNSRFALYLTNVLLIIAVSIGVMRAYRASAAKKRNT